jgi:hypothetical protein
MSDNDKKVDERTEKSSEEEKRRIENLLRMAQSLQSELKAQPRIYTNVGPYANRYNLFRKRTIELLGEESEAFLPELSEKLTRYGWGSNAEQGRDYLTKY